MSVIKDIHDNNLINYPSRWISSDQHCFACGKKLGMMPQLVTCKDDQTVHVGIECYRLIKATGKDGYQPPKGGPRLYLLQFKF